MDGIDQSDHVFDRGVGKDAVTQIKDVTGSVFSTFRGFA